jgi:hypothetical protein
MADQPLVQQFTGLPLGLLVCSPIIEVAKGQAELCRVYLEYVFKLAYADGQPPQQGQTKPANMISFTLNRPITSGTGQISQQAIQVNAPLIALVPIPAFTMQEATVSFTMEVKDQSVDTTGTTASAGASFGGSFWGFSASISGSVTTSSSNTRTTDNSAKYDITARAVQQPPAEGMARLDQIFASVIEPIPVGGGA